MIAPPAIAEALERAVDLGELGVQVAAYVGDDLVVDAWIGPADLEGARSVDGDTLFPIFSVTKGYTVTALQVQAERGLVDVDATVASYWPEFAAQGKESVRVRDVLSHRSGVPHLPPGSPVERMADWDAMARGIAALAPVSPPGTKSGYQARSMGWILGEVVRRTDPDRRPFCRFLTEEILAPLGIRDTWLGLPVEQEERLAQLDGDYSGPTPNELAPSRGMAYGGVTAPDIYRSRTARAACLPASGGITTARAEARFWAMLANGGRLGDVRLLSGERVRTFTTPRKNPSEFDDVLGLTPLIGAGGYWLGGSYPPAEAGVGDGAVICQPGAGGSVGWADLDRRLGVAICHNRMLANHPPRPVDRHPHTAIGEAVRAVADALRG